MAPPSPSPPPPTLTDLIEDVTAEIFLRLPPDEPEHLFRAALVCKPWLRILCDPGFLRRYRAFHGAPPLLGLLHIHDLRMCFGEPFPRLVTTTSVPAFPQPAGTARRSTRLLDCRHGRVLVFIHTRDGSAEDMGDGHRGYLHVWDPVTGDSHALPQPDIRRTYYTAAVLCATQGCNHLDCHGGPFCVAFIAAHKNSIFASTYASETGTWSTPTSVCIGSAVSFYAMRGTALGDEVHFVLANPYTDEFATVKYDWGKNCLSVMKSPPLPHRKVYGHYCHFALMAMEDSSLGLAAIVDSNLYLYSRKVNADGAALWVRCRVIDLEKVVPMAKLRNEGGPRAVGFAEGVGAVFVSTGVGLFTIELKSGRVKKVDEPATGFGDYFSILPYMSFYTPGELSGSSVAVLDYLDKPLQATES